MAIRSSPRVTQGQALLTRVEPGSHGHCEGMSPSKRRRTQRAGHLDVLKGMPNAPSSDIPRFSSLPTTAPSLLEPEGYSPYLMPPSDEEEAVPRVASSAHINELVAKYSHPVLEQEGWFPRYASHTATVGGAGSLSLEDVYIQMAREADAAMMPAVPVYGYTPALLPVPAVHMPVSPQLMNMEHLDASVSPRVAAVFEDLAVMAANANISAPGLDAAPACSPLVVEGLELEDETKQAVEKWLRDSPDSRGVGWEASAGGVRDLPQGLAMDEEEGSLPQWVLEELGESEAEGKPREPQRDNKRKLVRADSHGSSTNGPSISQKREAESDDQAVSSPVRRSSTSSNTRSSAVAEEALASSHPEASTHSSAGEHEGEEDEPSSYALSDDAPALNMSRSFSTSWIKGLLDDTDALAEDLASIDAALPLSPAQLFDGDVPNLKDEVCQE